MITVSTITVYPIKACAGVKVDRLQLDRLGPVHDRRFMIVGEDGVALTQRDARSLRMVMPKIQDGGLTVHAPNKGPLIVPFIQPDRPVQVKIWDDICTAVDCGSEAAEWFSGYLGRTSRLVYANQEFSRPVDRTYASDNDHTSFSDGFPLLLISEESLNELNSRLQIPIMMEQFRPNLVVRGCKAYAEDTWRKIRIGKSALSVVKPCARCVVTTINPQTGETSTEPLKTLAMYRRDKSGGVLFGQNVIHHDKSGSISIGDVVTLL